MNAASHTINNNVDVASSAGTTMMDSQSMSYTSFADPFDDGADSVFDHTTGDKTRDEGDFDGGCFSDCFFGMPDLYEPTPSSTKSNAGFLTASSHHHSDQITGSANTHAPSSSILSARIPRGGGCIRSEYDSNSKTTTPKDAFDNAVLALGRELQQLSMAERAKITEELHGVSSISSAAATTTAQGNNGDENADPSYIDRCLGQVHKNIVHIRGKTKEPYTKACLLAPEKYGKQNDEFYIKFLEATRYNTSEAAEKIVLNFYYKEMLFGTDKLTKTITLDDLSDDDMTALRSGQTMFLPGKDMADRFVVYQTARFLNVDLWENHVSTIYCECAILDD